MAHVRFVQVDDAQSVRDWQRIHNEIIEPDPLTLDEVRERSGRHHLELAYSGSSGARRAVGNSTARRPTEESGAMVIARVLPAHRRNGIGTRLYERALEVARGWADDRPFETVVLASNEDGLAFALARGFVEVDGYTLPGAEIPY